MALIRTRRTAATTTGAASAEVSGHAVDAIRPRFDLFDGLRAVAALLVFVDHSWFRWHPSSCGFSVCASSGGVLAGVWTDLAVGFGPLGVSVFYVISAFLLYRPFVAARLAGSSIDAVGYGIRRFARIFPAYWLALVVVLLVGAEVREQGVGDLVRLFTLTQAYSFKGLLYNPIPPTWTICVELSFYLFLPIWALLVRRWIVRSRRPVRAELACLVWLGALAVGWRWVVVENPAGSHGFEHLFGFIPLSDKLLISSLDLFAAGMALAVLSAHGKLAVLRRLTPTTAWVIAAFGFLVLSWLMAGNGPLGAHWKLQEVLGGGLRVPIAVLIVLPGVLARQSVDGRGVARLLGSRHLTGLGVISYGIYLWHAPMLAWVHSWTGQLQGVAIYTWLALAGASLGLTVCIALFSWRVLERPLISVAHARTGGRELERQSETPVPV